MVNCAHELSESDLCAEAKAGNARAIERLMERHRDRLTRRLRLRLELNPFVDFDLDDLMQEISLTVVRGISTFDVSRSLSFPAWLDRLADNRIAQMLRDRSRQKRCGSGSRSTSEHSRATCDIGEVADEAAQTGSHRAIYREAQRAVILNVAALPADQRDAIVAYYLERNDLTTIAKRHRSTISAVRSLIFRGKQALRELFIDASRWIY